MMKARRAALLGSWDPEWVKDHVKWLNKHGSHLDGWKNRVSKENRDLLQDAEKSPGYFNSYAYMPRSKGGSGSVEYRLRCIQLDYSTQPRSFRHAFGHHKDAEKYSARLRFRILRIKRLSNPLRLTQFRAHSGKYLKHPVELLRLPIVHDSFS